MNKKELGKLFKDSFKKWSYNRSTLKAAAITFFIILPLPSLLLIVLSFLSLFYGQTQATEQLLNQISKIVGPAVAGVFKDLISSSYNPFTSLGKSLIIMFFTQSSFKIMFSHILTARML